MSSVERQVFLARDTRGDYQSIRGWVVRETLLALLAVSVLTGSSIALYRTAWLGRAEWLKKVPPEALKALLAVSAVLTWRTVIWRPFVGFVARKAIYPASGSTRDAEAIGQVRWSEVPERTIITRDRNAIHARLLHGAQGQRNSGHVILVCPGNNMLYEEVLDPQNLADLQADGYSILVFHPPQYGRSTGTRTVRSDFLAAEACLQHLINARELNGCGFGEENVHLVGWSVGSGAAVEMMTKYSLGRSLLVVPLASIRSIATRLLGPVAAWFVNGAIGDYTEYQSVDKMPNLRTRELGIIEGEQDGLMSRGRLPREADQLRQAWIASKTGQRGFELRFDSRPAVGHNHLEVHAEMNQFFIPNYQPPAVDSEE